MMQDYFVELYDPLNRRGINQEYVNSDGSFTFHNVSFGDYEVRVINPAGQVVQRQFVSVSPTTRPVEFRLPHEEPTRPPSGPVSFTQLKHPPTRKAVGAFMAAQRFSQTGQYEKAAGELEKAIELSPEYAEAYTNLAAQHARMGLYEDALNDSKRALELRGPNAVDLCNMTFALTRLGRYPEAVDAGRAAVRLEPGNNKGHYLLGILLAMDWRTLQEGIHHLERAAETMPVARETLEVAKKLLAKAPPG